MRRRTPTRTRRRPCLCDDMVLLYHTRRRAAYRKLVVVGDTPARVPARPAIGGGGGLRRRRGRDGRSLAAWPQTPSFASSASPELTSTMSSSRGVSGAHGPFPAFRVILLHTQHKSRTTRRDVDARLVSYVHKLGRFRPIATASMGALINSAASEAHGRFCRG